MIPPSRGVDDAEPGLRSCEKVAPDEAHGLRGLRQVHRDEVRLVHELVEREHLDVHVPCTVGRHVGVVRAQPHAESESALRDECAHPAEPDDPERLAVQLHAFPLGPLPPAGYEGLVRLGNVAGLREQKGEGVLGRRQDVRLRRVHDHHPETGRRLRCRRCRDLSRPCRPRRARVLPRAPRRSPGSQSGSPGRSPA